MDCICQMFNKTFLSNSREISGALTFSSRQFWFYQIYLENMNVFHHSSLSLFFSPLGMRNIKKWMIKAHSSPALFLPRHVIKTV